MPDLSLLKPEELIRSKRINWAADVKPGHALLYIGNDLDKYVSQYKLIDQIALFDKNQIIYVLKTGGLQIAVVHPGIGAPMAVMTMEMLRALGISDFTLFGSCGCLGGNLDMNHLFIPSEAHSDEGTSKHYSAKTDVPQTVNPSDCTKISEWLTENEFLFSSGPVCTTDALFRETSDKISQYIKNGCRAIDMELSALLACAELHGLGIRALFHVTDCLTQNRWFTPDIMTNRALKSGQARFNLAVSIVKYLATGSS